MEPYYEDDFGTLYCGDSKEILSQLEPNSVDMIITSPPYWALRDYHADGQLGQEPLFKDYIKNLSSYFDIAHNILKPDGTLWVNIGDTYYGSGKGSGGSGAKSRKQTTNKGSYYASNKGNHESDLENAKTFKNKELKDRNLCQIPARFAIEMQDRNWILRNSIIWHKPNQMVFSGKNRFTQDYEYLYFFTKDPKNYYFEQQLEPYKSKENHKTRNKASEKYKGTNLYSDGDRDYYSQGGRNKRAVWSINTEPTKGSKHFAKYPKKLIETPIKAGCPGGGVVLDIFFGAGTTAVVAEKLNRKWIGIELNSEYCDEALERIIKERNGPEN